MSSSTRVVLLLGRERMARSRIRVSRLILAMMTVGLLHAPSPAAASNCAVTSVGFTPLTDLGAGLYHGFPGGLYGAGANVRPAAHEAAGVAIAHGMTPLDTLGNPSASGRIVFISIGMSNATQEFSTFVPKANAEPTRNPYVQVIDCAQGGQATQNIRTPSAAYWNYVATRLRAAGSTPLQAQAVWLKQARRSPTEPFPASAESLTNDLGAIVRILKTKLPNVKQVFFTSRIYAGYASSALNPEPFAYESGFAVKWLIDAQIAGEDSLNWDAGAGAVHAPWLSWGPYMWADGLTPRSDGLTWACSEFNSDGTHPATPGRIKVADSLLMFMKRDSATEPWFVNHAITSVTPGGARGLSLSIAPNPARGALDVTFATVARSAWSAEIVDLAGRRVSGLGSGIGDGALRTLKWNAGEAHRQGVYWVRVKSGGEVATRRAVVVAP